MPYTDRFVATDDLITHLQPIIATITDAQISSRYAGFLSVSAVTVYELAIKDIFKDFSGRKHKVFGHFAESHFRKINGRIQLDELKNTHIPAFGEKYKIVFSSKIESTENHTLRTKRFSIKQKYKDLILCRHKFVHVGNPTLSASEVIDYYESGKEIIHVLHHSLYR